MPAERKTVNVKTIVETANRMLSNTADDRMLERRTIIYFVESLLLNSNAYHGFKYLSSELDEFGHLLPNYDDTRRAYLYA